MNYPECKMYSRRVEGKIHLFREFGFCLKFQQWLPLAQSIPCGNKECRERCQHFVRREGTPYLVKEMNAKMRRRIAQ